MPHRAGNFGQFVEINVDQRRLISDVRERLTVRTTASRDDKTIAVTNIKRTSFGAAMVNDTAICYKIHSVSLSLSASILVNTFSPEYYRSNGTLFFINASIAPRLKGEARRMVFVRGVLG